MHHDHFAATRRPLVSAHRGFSKKAPENTLPALELAWRAGADFAEIDVRLSSDRKLVLMHDATVDRTTNGTGPIAAMSVSEAKRLDAGGWFGESFSGTSVPTLDEVLDWSRDRLKLLIELKNYPERDPAFLDEFIDTVTRHDAVAFSIAACFDHPILTELHHRRPDWSIEMILPCRLTDPIHAARTAGANLISMEPEFVVASDVASLAAAGISVLTTIVSVEHGGQLLDSGVTVFESDDVELACEARRTVASDAR